MLLPEVIPTLTSYKLVFVGEEIANDTYNIYAVEEEP